MKEAEPKLPSRGKTQPNFHTALTTELPHKRVLKERSVSTEDPKILKNPETSKGTLGTSPI